MELVLVRHAIAHERDVRRWPDDDTRPLSARGEMRAQQACRGLRRLMPPPLRLFTSPLARARQTAVLLARCAGWPRPVLCDELRPGTAPAEVFALLRRAAPRVALVGHEPDLGELLAVCLGTRTPLAFKKMGVARVSFQGSVRAGAAQLTDFLPPRVLRAAAPHRH